jgi:hypothetical protein
MALDAFVYCDCFETENLRCDPPAGVKVVPRASGDLLCDTLDDEAWSAFVGWKHTKACLHHGMILLRHRLGTEKRIHALRTELQKESDRFPMLLEKILYSGTHTCDWIPLDYIDPLANEVKQLNASQAGRDVADALHLFQIQMAELIIAAKHTRKPICF